MQFWSVTVRSVDGLETSVSFEARSRDEALFEAGLFYGTNYSGRWAFVKIEAGVDVF